MRAPAGAEGEARVVVPPAWAIGSKEKAPPADQLRPGALGGELMPRAPKTFYPGVVPDGDGGFKEDRAGYSARIDRDGSIHFKDKKPVGMTSVVSGWFDVTDALMRALGDDPYAYEKMRIMEQTREVRAGMAVADRSARLLEAQRKLGRYLEKIWEHPRWTVVEKRRIYFALWDEAAEDGDAEILRAAEMARATILAFVRRRLPEGSPAGYSEAELTELNRKRTSQKRFAPY